VTIAPRDTCKCILPRLTALLLGLMVMASTPAFGQKKPERFWLAGRYDGDRVVVYFDAVKFKGTMLPNSHKISVPVVSGFFDPVVVPASYIARFQTGANAEHFAIGDRYDLLPGNGTIATIKLSTLVACETDEEVGNDSYVGALGTVEKKDSLVSAIEYFAVRRHQEPQRDGAKARPKTTAEYLKYASLKDEPIRFDIETRIVELLDQRMKLEATDIERRVAGDVQPALKVQPFQVADGSLRYYVRAEWKSGKERKGASTYVLAAWITPLPTLRILAVEKRTSPYDGIDDGLASLLNVVDLGDGRTGIIVHIAGEDSTQLDLKEYRDGVNLHEMDTLQSISTGE
jgi:hypothetical protein